MPKTTRNIMLLFILSLFGMVNAGAFDSCDVDDYVQTPADCGGACVGFYYGWSCGDTDDEHYIEQRWADDKLVWEGADALDTECSANTGDVLATRCVLATNCGWTNPKGEWVQCCNLICGDLYHFVGLDRRWERGPVPGLWGGGWPFSGDCPGNFEWRPSSEHLTVRPGDITWISDDLGYVYTGFTWGNPDGAPEGSQAGIQLTHEPRRGANVTVTWRTYSVPSCRGDVTGDGAVGYGDVLATLAAWGGTGRADWNRSGIVDFADLDEVLSSWGACWQ